MRDVNLNATMAPHASPLVRKIGRAGVYNLIGLKTLNAPGMNSLPWSPQVRATIAGCKGVTVNLDYVASDDCAVLAFFAGENSINKDSRAKESDRPTWWKKKHHFSSIRVRKDMLLLMDSLTQDDRLLDEVMALANGRLPRRVVCTGHGVAGGLATIAALWAAVHFPTADVRCITFGAPPVGDKPFKQAFNLIVAYSYRVVYKNDPTPNMAKQAYKHVKGLMWHDGHRFARPDLAQTDDLNNMPKDADIKNYATILIDLLGPAFGHLAECPASPPAITTEVDAALPDNGAARREQRAITKREHAVGSRTDFAGAAEGEEDLMKMLFDGKIHQGVLLAVSAYHPDGLVAPPSGADQAAFQQKLDEVFRADTKYERSIFIERHIRAGDEYTDCENEVVKAKSDLKSTEVHVAYDGRGTAVFAFRGTNSTMDVWDDINYRMKDVDFMQNCVPGVRPQSHAGFMNQFSAVIDPLCPKHHIGKALEQLCEGATPTRIICCGHSLGGALAILCAAWAAFEFPHADVRCITIGAPRVGNKDFVKVFSYLVGGVHRLVHSGDVVPCCPLPCCGHKHVEGGMWLHRGNVSTKASCYKWREFMSCLGGVHCIRHHFTDIYVNKVAKHCTKAKEEAAEVRYRAALREADRKRQKRQAALASATPSCVCTASADPEERYRKAVDKAGKKREKMLK